MNFFWNRQNAIKCVLFLLTFATASLAIAEPHDDLVYQRYSPKVAPGKIHFDYEMKFKQLTHPATQADVEAGNAVFTFEGLGPSRLWYLPECPMDCNWPSLKDFPYENYLKQTNYDDSGKVCQAEELLVDGQWKRYFGFVCKHGVAVVPAEDIYLSFDTCDCNDKSGINWNQLPGGVDLGIYGPGVTRKNGTNVPVELDIGHPVPVDLYVRNRRGVAQNVLWDLYRGATNGGPAFHSGIEVSLEWAPYDVKNPDKNYPRSEDYKPISVTRSNFFNGGDKGAMLAPGERVVRGTFDLRDWCNLTVPGYYLYHLEFDPAQLGLLTDEGRGGGIGHAFTLGKEPRRLTFEELDQNIPAFGGATNEAKIRSLIQQSFDEEKRTQTNIEGSSPKQPASGSLPKLDYTPFMGDNMSGDESEVVQLSIPNEHFLDGLDRLDRNEARITLETLMQKEKVMPMKLLLASSAMTKNSPAAALFVFDCMTNTDYTMARNTQDALRLALNHCGTNPPAWLVEMACAALSDDRYMTGIQYAVIDGITNVLSSDTISKMSDSADGYADLAYALGYTRCTNVVPFLIDLAMKTNGNSGPVMALGFIGDKRAIPVLIDFVKQKGPSTTLEKGDVLNDGFLRAVEALGNLHAREAVPVLLEYIRFPDVIDALEQIGDARVIEPLQKLISADGKIAGVPADAELEKERVVEAKIAVATLDSTNRTDKLCALFADKSFDEFQRRSVVWRLGEHPDSRAIPFLATAIKTDPSGSVVNQAITVLAVFKYKAAVDTLIDSFDADFKGKEDWKRAYKPEMFRKNIADSLQSLTGQQIGPDKEQWMTWWKAHRDASPQLN